MAKAVYRSCEGSLLDLLGTLDADTERLVLCGPYPELVEWRRWFEAANGEWSLALRQVRSDGRCLAYAERGERRVRISSMADWTGAVLTPGEARNVMRHVSGQLCRVFRVEYVPTITPALTGLYLWQQTAGREIEPLPEGVQQLIRATESQQREELLTMPELQTIPAFYYSDLRLAYPSCCTELPVGPVEHMGVIFDVRLGDRGRCRVEVSIPNDWAHVGLLPFHDGDREGWVFPAEPGRRFTTWADCSEVRLAVSHGWRCVVKEALLFRRGRCYPLDTWRDRLMSLHEREEDARAAPIYRAICLHAIGAFHGRGRTETVTGPAIAGTRITPMVERRTARAAEFDQLSHPEWTAAIWARARRKLAVAALTLPREAILGMRLDAIYSSVQLTNAREAPMGQFRLKGAVRAAELGQWVFCGGGDPPEFPAPHSKPALNRLATLAESHLNALG